VRKKATTSEEITITQLDTRVADFYILGKSPLLYNSISFHTMKGLLYPEKKSRAARETTLKHNPPEEFRASAYLRQQGEKGPTKLVCPARWFKTAMVMVARRIPGATMTEIKQLVWVLGDNSDLYGTPELFMGMVRQAGPQGAPDVRTRAKVRNWATKISVQYVVPHLSVDTVGKLLSSAGLLQGVGDNRVEKGGNNGQFELVAPNDPRYKAILKEGYTVQERALEHPVPYDVETERLLRWWHMELERRREGSSSAPLGQKLGNRHTKSKTRRAPKSNGGSAHVTA
jgi:hypothetical protein